MAASTLSLGMFTARAFWITRRSVGFDAGSLPPAFTAMLMSLAMRANCFAMRFQRANIACLRTSKIRPMRQTLWPLWGGYGSSIHNELKHRPHAGAEMGARASGYERRDEPSLAGELLLCAR